MSIRILFMGTPDFAVPILEALVHSPYEVIGVVTQPDKLKGRKRELTPPPVKLLAQQHNLPVLQPEKIRQESAYQPVLQMQPDLIITAAYGQLLPTPIIRAPKYGCINVHASLLPKYRGGAPIHWAIINGEKETGITLMYMVEQLDAGDMIAQRKVPISREDTVGKLYEKLQQAGAQLLLETLPSLIDGKVTPIPQDDRLATYAPNLRREDERIDWHRTAEEVYNQIRGLNPWPVAYTVYHGEVWKIWWGEPVDQEHQASPGTILHVTPDALMIACGRGVLKLTEVQPAGRRKMAVADVLRGKQMLSGERFEGEA